MARPTKENVEYFPHYSNARNGKTLKIIHRMFGNDGYASFFKILEILGETKGHYYDYREFDDWIFLVTELDVNEEKAEKILDMLARTKAIDRELHAVKIIWSDNFAEGLIPVYSKRKKFPPQKPSFRDGNLVAATVTVTESTQRKGKESKGKDREEEKALSEKIRTTHMGENDDPERLDRADPIFHGAGGISNFDLQRDHCRGGQQENESGTDQGEKNAEGAGRGIPKGGIDENENVDAVNSGDMVNNISLDGSLQPHAHEAPPKPAGDGWKNDQGGGVNVGDRGEIVTPGSGAQVTTKKNNHLGQDAGGEFEYLCETSTGDRHAGGGPGNGIIGNVPGLPGGRCGDSGKTQSSDGQGGNIGGEGQQCSNMEKGSGKSLPVQRGTQREVGCESVEVKQIDEPKEVSRERQEKGQVEKGEAPPKEEKRYRTKKRRILKGMRLLAFEEFWIEFHRHGGKKAGKAAAADSWLDLDDYYPELLKQIIHGAKEYAKEREDILSRGGTPKMAQGWLTDRRWEDWPMESERPKQRRFRTKEEILKEYGRKDLQPATVDNHRENTPANPVGEGSGSARATLQVLFGK